VEGLLSCFKIRESREKKISKSLNRNGLLVLLGAESKKIKKGGR
jgi:hypothetical protein